ncbi:TRAP transporter small permease [Enterocloster clostridioformis]|uniref:TRAP transporter small permease n=1 Tax=Enterocloster clostridioformis TaxID=1531 RepID=UPI00232DAE91|nr:TRAP transporter small permease subunit [Enterocloster clostridioformis]MDB2142127.1 TRAP transporter small permease subunit [Enterocloster clostridioformis]MDB2145688.1 TRAP transporter small permease subunit [Enterocloster clostridioformis]
MVCFLQMLFRFVFNLPLAWTEELSRYVFIILTYCGASTAVLDNAHVRVELIDNVLSGARFALDIFLVFVFLGIPVSFSIGLSTVAAVLTKGMSLAFQPSFRACSQSRSRINRLTVCKHIN